MLRHSFAHIKGVGDQTERSLWSAGCLSWSDYLEDPSRFSAGQMTPEEMTKAIKKQQRALERGEHQFFQRSLGLKESWRAFPDFRDSCVYLDIETDGGTSGNSITTIGMYDGAEFQCLIKGHDLENFRDVITHYSMIVTFFGASFDVPMLQKRFPDVKFDHIHLDLCPTLRRIGLRGGLKKIEKQMGLARGEDTDGLSGLDAIRLWNRYIKLGDEGALETLVAYNREDVVNLEKLAEHAYSELRRLTFESVVAA